MFIAALFTLGLLIGSFLNAVIWRLRVGKSVWKGRSMCPGCRHQLSAAELIPLASWVALGGKCRWCKAAISPQYPLVEFATGALFTVSYLALQPASAGEWAGFVLWLYVLSSLIVLAVYDLKWMLLPDVVLLPAIGVMLAVRVVEALAGQPPDVWAKPLLAALANGGLFYALAAISGGKWMGGGDIKLAFLMGLVLGLQKTALALLFAYNGAAIISLVLIALRLKKRTDYIPFGPFLSAATVISFLWGGNLMRSYFDMMLVNLS